MLREREAVVPGSVRKTVLMLIFGWKQSLPGMISHYELVLLKAIKRVNICQMSRVFRMSVHGVHFCIAKYYTFMLYQNNNGNLILYSGHSFPQIQELVV